jgi:hypothetical protein
MSQPSLVSTTNSIMGLNKNDPDFSNSPAIPHQRTKKEDCGCSCELRTRAPETFTTSTITINNRQTNNATNEDSYDNRQTNAKNNKQITSDNNNKQ